VNLPAGGLTRIGQVHLTAARELPVLQSQTVCPTLESFAFAWAPIESANIYQGVIESHAI